MEGTEGQEGFTCPLLHIFKWMNSVLFWHRSHILHPYTVIFDGWRGQRARRGSHVLFYTFLNGWIVSFSDIEVIYYTSLKNKLLQLPMLIYTITQNYTFYKWRLVMLESFTKSKNTMTRNMFTFKNRYH